MVKIKTKKKIKKRDKKLKFYKNKEFADREITIVMDAKDKFDDDYKAGTWVQLYDEQTKEWELYRLDEDVTTSNKFKNVNSTKMND